MHVLVTTTFCSWNLSDFVAITRTCIPTILNVNIKLFLCKYQASLTKREGGGYLRMRMNFKLGVPNLSDKNSWLSLPQYTPYWGNWRNKKHREWWGERWTTEEQAATFTARIWMLSRSVVSHSLQPHGLRPTSLFYPLDFSDKNSGVGYRFLLQGIFLTRARTHVFFIAGRFFTTEPPDMPWLSLRENVKGNVWQVTLTVWVGPDMCSGGPCFTVFSF